MTPNPAAQARARAHVRLLFGLMGFAFAVWGVHIPSLKQAYGLDEGGVALALLAVAAGAVGSTLFAGRCIARWGVPRTVRASGLVLCATLAPVLLLGHPLLLAPLLLVMGVSTALLDVAVNSEASRLEELGGRKVMSGFHALFSLGGMFGALAGAVLLRLQVPPAVQMIVLALAMALLVEWGRRGLLPLAPPAAHGSAGPRSRWPPGPLALLGLLAVLALVGEGAMYDWSVLYRRQETGAPPAGAALGFASFSAAMAAGRFGGDWARERWSGGNLLVAGGLLAAFAMGTTLWLRDAQWALVGFALVGLGFANAVPVLFMAASRVPGVPPAQGIATVVTMGYSSMMLGPALVGGIAEVSSLSTALAVVGGGALLMALGALRLSPPR